jgi:putative FmdB family regulatory protein
VPIYEYKCEQGHVFEVLQSMSDDPIAQCEVCEAPVERVFHPIAVHFKGSGFYTTDYKNKKSETTDRSEKKPEKKSEKKEPASSA